VLESENGFEISVIRECITNRTLQFVSLDNGVFFDLLIILDVSLYRSIRSMWTKRTFLA